MQAVAAAHIAKLPPPPPIGFGRDAQVRHSRWKIEFHLLESIEIGDYASVAACLDYGYDWSFHSNPWGEKRKRKREFSPHHHHRFLPTGGGDHHQVDDYHEDDDDDLESIDYTLHHAVVLGNYRIVSMLLHSGAPLNIHSNFPIIPPSQQLPCSPPRAQAVLTLWNCCCPVAQILHSPTKRAGDTSIRLLLCSRVIPRQMRPARSCRCGSSLRREPSAACRCSSWCC